MAIFGNFKGTTQSEFKIGKSDGNKISTGTRPSANLVAGDLYLDSSNTSIQVYNSGWVNVGSTLTELNVDDGTLYVDSSNDTVSIGSTSSNDKLFVNGSLRLGTNPALKYSGAYLDVQHSNGTATNLRIRDNSSGSDPTFKVFNANNSTEVFKISGNEAIFADSVKAKFGTGGDLEIYHDGTNSYIDDAGTGSLFVRSGTTYFQNLAGTKTSIQTNSGGAQTFYHNNSAKLATSATGITVTGTVDVNGAYTFPSADGNANQILATDGSGSVSFVDNTPTPGGSNTQIQFNDSGSFNGHANLTFNSATETLGTTNLSVTNFTYSVLSEDYGSIGETVTTTKDYGDITDEASGDFLNDVVEDTTPQLGGNLDLNSNSITGTGDINNTGNVNTQIVTAKSYKDTVYTITDGASVDIDPDNGGIQVWTLGANRTPTASNFDAGAKIMLMIDDGSSYSITWPSVNWVGGVAPTLATSGYSIIELWKVGSQLYGAFAGGVA